MTKMSKEEVIKIAQISAIDLHPDEIPTLIKHLDAVLSYAERVKEIAQTIEEPSNKNINVFREDVVAKSDYGLIMAQAPQEEENFFVVPAILDK